MCSMTVSKVTINRWSPLSDCLNGWQGLPRLDGWGWGDTHFFSCYVRFGPNIKKISEISGMPIHIYEILATPQKYSKSVTRP